MVRQVPPEIWWLVIDCLGEAREYKTLINCMLVNRRWHERSTKYLSHVIFDSQNSVASLALSRGQYIGRRWAGPSRVSIVGEGARVDQRTLIQHLGTFAQMLAGRWTQVNSLVIERAKLSVSMLPSICLDFAAWDSISTLVLRNVEFPTAAMLSSLLNSLPGLCDLTCGDVLFAEQPRRSPRELHARIGTLTMSSIQLDPDDHPLTRAYVLLVGFLCAVGIGSNTMALDLKLGSAFHATTARDMATQKLLDDGAYYLRKLQLHVPLREPLSDVPQPSCNYPLLDISELAQVRHISMDIYLSDSLTPYSFDSLCKFLSGVTSDDISLITLDFHLPDTGTPEQIRAIAEGLVINGFPKIDEVLSRPIFATLQRVFMSAIQPTRTRMPTEYRPNWELYLPNLVERDLVWVDWGFDF